MSLVIDIKAIRRDFPLGQEIVNNKIYDFLGQYKKVIDVSHLSKGVYFVQLKTDNEIFNKKIILSK